MLKRVISVVDEVPFTSQLRSISNRSGAMALHNRQGSYKFCLKIDIFHPKIPSSNHFHRLIDDD